MTTASAPAPSAAPIAIVIPVFRHSALFLEALASVRAACDRGLAHAVIVDDGCPYFQTALSGTAAAGGQAHYIRQTNRGLSGARNCGIDFVLTHLPECQAIYFLDADNRLSSYSFDRFFEALAARPDIDWFYPDITMFGIGWKSDYSGPFRCLVETQMNICEAGSLVRRRVFEAGSRFDEKMRAGYEDWEFWISLMAGGFMGAHLPASGFNYRKRAESMLVESSRRHQEIMEYIETKHSWLRDISTMVSLEHVEAPRFAVLSADVGQAMLGSDPMRLRDMSLQAYSEQLRLSLARPNWAGAGYCLVFASQEALDHLGKAGLARAVFWRAEVALQTQNFVSVTIASPNDGFVVLKTTERREESDLVFVSMRLTRSILADSSDAWIRAIVDRPEELGCAFLEISAPGLAPPDARWRKQTLEVYEFMRRERMKSPPALWSGGGDWPAGTPDLTLLPETLRKRFNGGVLPCSFDRSTPRAAFVLPVMEFGGVEKVAFQVARQFRSRGYRADVIIYGVDCCYRYDAFSDAYDDVFIIDQVRIDWGGAIYEGTHLSSDRSKAHPEVQNLLSAYDVIVNCHVAGALYSFADLKKTGAVTINYVHLLEYSMQGRAKGHPVIALAFEHSTDIIACCSQQMADQMTALGAPREKVVAVPNGVGADISPVHVRSAALRRERASAGPLNVLYFGRLDEQKGLDRLAEIAAALLAEPERFVLRLVGGRIVDSGAGAVDLAALGPLIEPPVYDDDAIAGLYTWADVMIMPSRYEGLPLAIIEAMTLGCAPIATDVGAVREAIRSGENGHVVANDEKAAAAMIALLGRLADDRAELARLSANAMASAAERDWSHAAAPLIDRVDALRAQRARLRKPPPRFRPLLRDGSARI